jgi:ABC-type nitrate/sulfonate/bicarbonate transport system ATPase subunit
LTDLLRALRDDGAALALVTHSVDEGLALSTHAAIVLDGRIRRLDATAGLNAALYEEEYRLLAVEGAA